MREGLWLRYIILITAIIIVITLSLLIVLHSIFHFQVYAVLYAHTESFYSTTYFQSNKAKTVALYLCPHLYPPHLTLGFPLVQDTWLSFYLRW